jgi:hypothetical protein
LLRLLQAALVARIPKAAGLASGTERLLQRNAGVLTVSTFTQLLRPNGSSIAWAASEDVDLAIRQGNGVAPGLHITRLCAEE